MPQIAEARASAIVAVLNYSQILMIGRPPLRCTALTEARWTPTGRPADLDQIGRLRSRVYRGETI